MPKIRKHRQIEIMQYYEHFNNEQLENVFRWLDNLDCSYLCVQHDRDESRAPHFHLFIKLENARTFEDIASQCNIKKQYVQKIEKGWKNALAYAFHLTDSAKNDGKYRYDESAVIRKKNVDVQAIFDINTQYEEDKLKEEDLKKYIFKYGECEISKKELLDKLDAKTFNKHALLIKRMREYRLMKVRDRDMQVLYICGASGSGKTTVAKYFARVFGYDYFVSGSGKDVLDGYDKEECIILDDLRADVFTKAELFKLTDNNTNSSVKSRYNNKDISYCKLMIITSIKTPHTLYNWEDGDKDETFKQFARRLNNVFIYIHENGDVWECRYTDPQNANCHIDRKQAPFDMQQVFSVLGIERRVGYDVMKTIYEKVVEDITKDTSEKAKGEDLPF